MAVYAFGSNFFGQLNQPSNINESARPLEIQELSNKRIIKIACGRMHSIILCEGNELYGWGVNDEFAFGSKDQDDDLIRRIPFEYEIVDMCAGASYSALLTSRGEVFISGTFRTDGGVYGATPAERFAMNFQKVQGLGRIVKIGGGGAHVIAIDQHGDIWSFGANQACQLGRIQSRRNPKESLNPSIITSQYSRGSKKFVEVTGSDNFSIAMNNAGECFGWGRSSMGELGYLNENAIVGKLKFPIENIRQIACGRVHTMLLNNMNELYASGANTDYQCGLPDKESYEEFAFIAADVDQVKCGDYFTVIRKQNTLYCCGLNIQCSAGVADQENVMDFTMLDFDFGKIETFECGGAFTIVYSKK